jgi:quercetin dioxygenase-like cupin family protein
MIVISITSKLQSFAIIKMKEAGMSHINLKDIQTEINIRGIKAKTLVDHNNATIKNLILDKGDKIPNHQVPVDVTFFVLQGKGTITIDGVDYHVKPMDTITCPPNTIMSVQADTNQDLSFLNIKTPGFKPKK